jgi:enoyl-CoA hydratase/carnithine racemase
VGGEEAVRLGLATQLSAHPYEDALLLAAEISMKSPDAIRSAKRLLSTSLDTSPFEQFDREKTEIAALKGTTNQREAVMAYFEKRSPHFDDPVS